MIKGNVLVGQSGGPTAAINATLSGVIEAALQGVKEGTIEHVYGMKNGIEGFLQENLIEIEKVIHAKEDLELLSKTPASALGSCRKKLPQDREDPIFKQLFSLFEKYNIQYFFYIGGNDSMDTVAKLQAAQELFPYKVHFMGVPKTIDNDLEGTDHTPGFGSAAKFIACTVEEICRDCSVYTTPAVTIVEIMGRDAGWLTCASAIPNFLGEIGPDYIYLPERPFSLDQFLMDVKVALSKHPNIVVCVSEGIHDAEGTYIGSMGQSGAVDAFGHKYLAGTGKVLEQFIKDQLGCKVRSIELNLPQRCAGHLLSKTDIEESIEIGKKAFELALQGKTGEVVVVNRISSDPYRIMLSSKPVSQIANFIRTVPDSYILDSSNGITNECFQYLIPLIQGEMDLPFTFGIPHHFTF